MKQIGSLLVLDNYEVTEDGVIKQKEYSKFTYDREYIDSSYNSYGILGMSMSHLRFGWMLLTLKYTPTSILDIGYGNGDFLKLCEKSGVKAFGNDISTYDVPYGVKFVDDIFEGDYDVISFFDSLEHFEDIEFVSKLSAKYIYISVPNCYNFSEEWFDGWKHKRPNEHLHHFNEFSLTKFMLRMGYSCIGQSNIEDVIRGRLNGHSNILTMMFKKGL